MHLKLMIFAGQNTIQFGSANFSDYEFVPVALTLITYRRRCTTPTTRRSWTCSRRNSTIYGLTPRLQRVRQCFGTDAFVRALSRSVDLNIPPGQSFTTRLIKLENAETQQIDVAMYRITQQSPRRCADCCVSPRRSVRYMAKHESPAVSRLWVSYNMDRIYAAGIPMRVRAHEGLNHQKLVLLYGQGMSVFGSSNFTSPSDNSQQENNYFTTKAWMFQWFQAQSDRQWNNSTPPAISSPSPSCRCRPTSPLSNHCGRRYRRAHDGPTAGVVRRAVGAPLRHLPRYRSNRDDGLSEGAAAWSKPHDDAESELRAPDAAARYDLLLEDRLQDRGASGEWRTDLEVYHCRHRTAATAIGATTIVMWMANT